MVNETYKDPLSYFEIGVKADSLLRKFAREEIPDSRKIKERRLSLVGHLTKDEELVREHLPDEWERPRLITLPVETLRELYQRTIPLSCALNEELEIFRSDERKMHISSWIHNDSINRDKIPGYQKTSERDSQILSVKGIPHLTTNDGLQEVINILGKTKIPSLLTTVRIPFTRYVGGGHERLIVDVPALATPHSYCEARKGQIEYENKVDGIYMHLFVPHLRPIVATPFLLVEDKTAKVYSSEERKDNECYSYRGSIDHQFSRTLKRDIVYTDPSIDGANHWNNPVNFLPELIQSEIVKNKGKSSRYETVILKIGEPECIYDPSWVK